MVPTTPASSAASRSAAWLCERRASVEPLGNVHLFPPLVFTSRNSTAAPCLRKQTAATCNGSDFETRAEPMGESPANMLLARYFTNVKVQQILCSRVVTKGRPRFATDPPVDWDRPSSHIFFGAQVGERRGQRNEVRMVEVGLLDSR